MDLKSMSKIYVILAPSQSGKSLFAKTMMSEMYTEDLYGSDRNHGKVTGTPAIERLAQHLMDYEADFLKNWRVPPFYSETGEITNPNLSKEERLKKWETWARANLNIIGNRNRTVSYQYEGPMNSDERVMKEFLEKHVMTFADGPARLPKNCHPENVALAKNIRQTNPTTKSISARASVKNTSTRIFKTLLATRQKIYSGRLTAGKPSSSRPVRLNLSRNCIKSFRAKSPLLGLTT